MAETVGQRLYLIRLACGDGVRTAETLRAFAVRVERETGQHYDPMTLSLLERMKQTWTLEDINTFTAVDPLKRSPSWLAWGQTAEPTAVGNHYERIAESHGLPVVKEGADAEKVAETKKAPAKGARASGKHRRHG